jgi:translation initiation factor IF-2
MWQTSWQTRPYRAGIEEYENSASLKLQDLSASRHLINGCVGKKRSHCSLAMQMGMFVSIQSASRRQKQSKWLLVTILWNCSAEDEVNAETLILKMLRRRTKNVVRWHVGHVDHSKTSLLGYIRTANWWSRRNYATRWAYSVANWATKEENHFLGYTGTRSLYRHASKGTKVTDINYRSAADDSVMPQTREAINRPKCRSSIIIAINKVISQGQSRKKSVRICRKYLGWGFGGW